VLGRLVGDEGKGSLHAYLMHRGSRCDASADPLLVAERYEDVLAALFEYIHMLKTTGIPDRIYQDIEQLSQMEFNYREKEDPDDVAMEMARMGWSIRSLPTAWRRHTLWTSWIGMSRCTICRICVLITSGQWHP
jgi:secreted Zn-dependent insulinase-like peptidase